MNVATKSLLFWKRLGTIPVVATLWLSAASVTAFAGGPAHIIIADQFNNRVIEVDPQTHRCCGTLAMGPTLLARTA